MKSVLGKIPNFEIQIFNQGEHLFVKFWTEEPGHLLECAVHFGGNRRLRVQFPSDEPVRYVDVLLPFLFGSIFLEKVADLDVEVGEEGSYFGPGLVSVRIHEGPHASGKTSPADVTPAVR